MPLLDSYVPRERRPLVQPLRPLAPVKIQPRRPVTLERGEAPLTQATIARMVTEAAGILQQEIVGAIPRWPIRRLQTPLPSPIHLPEPGELLALAAGTSTTPGGANRGRCPLCLR
ncbi:MAG TPA: hypothetical protein VF156_15605 [Agromyces sp.]